MRVNTDRKTIDIEARDINYALGAYVISYLYASKNEDPKEIIFPKFPAIPHPRTGVLIPIRYVEIDEPIVQEIIEDGKDISEEQIVEVPREETEENPPIFKDENITSDKESAEEGEPFTLAKALEGGPTVSDALEAKESGAPKEELSPAKAALEKAKADAAAKQTDRKPKMPEGGDIGVGHPDDIGSKDVGFERKIISDLKPEAKVDESKELDTDIDKPKE